MSKYYALISGLPNISLEQQRPPYTQDEFYAELEEILSNKDRELLDWLRLDKTNTELIDLYRSGTLDAEWNEDEEPVENEEISTLLPLSELHRVIRDARAGIWVKKSEELPNYMLRFLNERYYTAPEGEAEQPALSPLSDEDRLAQLYFSSATKSKNKFVAAWFQFNQTLRNVLALYTCRRLGWEAERYIVGDSEIEEKLLTSKAKDFDLGEVLPDIASIIAIAEETNIAKRERLIDALRWKWLEEETETSVFDIENVLSYYLRLGIIERWSALDKEKGEEVFRQIVLGLKAESSASLDEFRRSTKKT